MGLRAEIVPLVAMVARIQPSCDTVLFRQTLQQASFPKWEFLGDVRNPILPPPQLLIALCRGESGKKKGCYAGVRSLEITTNIVK